MWCVVLELRYHAEDCVVNEIIELSLIYPIEGS
jgi:hypothetical protein